jgi:hypothetical protein
VQYRYWLLSIEPAHQKVGITISSASTEMRLDHLFQVLAYDFCFTLIIKSSFSPVSAESLKEVSENNF